MFFLKLLLNQESPFPVKPDMFPTWPAKSEMMKRPKKRDYEHSPKPPEGGEMFAKLVSARFRYYCVFNSKVHISTVALEDKMFWGDPN